MKIIMFTLLGLLLLRNAVVAQDSVRGKIVDAVTMEALPGASIYTGGGAKATFSDARGSFVFACACNKDSLHVQAAGYARKKVPCTDGPIALQPTANEMEEIVITASREAQLRSEAPMAIDRIGASVINDCKPTVLAEVINKVPGVTMLNLNNEQHGMAIRQPMGTSPYYLYLEDGIPLRTMGAFNHNALIEMNLFAISSVEIVKGPSSAVYGPEAVGGALNFITLRPSALTSVKAGVHADNYGYRRVQYGAGGKAGKKIGYYVGGFNAIQRNGWISNSDYNKHSVNGRLDVELSARTRVTFAGAVNDYFSRTPGNVDSVAFYQRSYSTQADFTFRKVNSIRARTTVEQKWNERNNSTVHFFLRRNSIEQNPAYAIRWVKSSLTARGEHNTHTTRSAGVITQHSVKIPALRARIIAGASTDISPVDYEAHQVDLSAELRPGGLSVENYRIAAERPELLLSRYAAVIINSGAYLQGEYRPAEKMLITAGMRFDDMRFSYSNFLDHSEGIKNYTQFSPRLGATYSVHRNAGVYANCSRGFSPPSLSTIFTRKTNGVDFYYELQPAHFNSIETGGWAALMKTRLNLHFTLYQMTGSNEQVNVRMTDNSSEFRSAGSTMHRGVEYNASYRISDRFSFRFGGTSALHRYTEFVLSDRASDVQHVNGKIMPSAPSRIINSEVICRPGRVKGLKLALEWQHLGSWYMNQVNTRRYEDRGVFGLKGVSVLNLRCSYEYHALEIFLNVMNLTNELYAHNATAGNSGGPVLYTAAAPRTFAMGIQYHFISTK